MFVSDTRPGEYPPPAVVTSVVFAVPDSARVISIQPLLFRVIGAPVVNVAEHFTSRMSAPFGVDSSTTCEVPASIGLRNVSSWNSAVRLPLIDRAVPQIAVGDVELFNAMIGFVGRAIVTVPDSTSVVDDPPIETVV